MTRRWLALTASVALSTIAVAGCGSSTDAQAPVAVQEATVSATPQSSVIAPAAQPSVLVPQSVPATPTLSPSAQPTPTWTDTTDQAPAVPTGAGTIAAPNEMAVVPEGVTVDPNAPNGVTAVRASLVADSDAIVAETTAGPHVVMDPEEARAKGFALQQKALKDRGYVEVDPEVYISSRMVTGPIWYETYGFILMAVPYQYGICEAIMSIPAVAGTKSAILCGTHEEFDKRAVELGVAGPGKPLRDTAKAVVAEGNKLIDAGADPFDAFAKVVGAKGFTGVSSDQFPAEPALVPAGAKLATSSVTDQVRTFKLATNTVIDGVAASCIMPLSTTSDGKHLFMGMKDFPVCAS